MNKKIQLFFSFIQHTISKMFPLRTKITNTVRSDKLKNLKINIVSQLLSQQLGQSWI